MNRVLFQLLLLGWVTLLGRGSVLAAEPSPKVVAQIKQATAFVEQKGRFGSGSAFCVSPQGYFVTCAHVVEPMKLGEAVDLTINPGLPDAKTLEATILRLAPDRDIAILKVEAEKLPFLPMGDSGKLRETQQILVSGFPLGRDLDAEAELPAVTLSTGRVTALRRDGEFVSEIQIDAQLNPGNSGGPILDLDGKVVGVAASRIFLTELNFGVSTFWVNAIMNSPMVRLENIPPLPDGKEVFELPFSMSYIRTPEKIGVTVSLIGAATGEQELDVRSEGEGKFVAKGVPNSSGDDRLSATLRADAIRQIGNITQTQHYSVLDQMIKINGEDVRLSELAAILPLKNEVISVRGVRKAGEVTGLSSVRTSGDGGRTVNLSAGYEALLIRPETAIPEEVHARIRINSDGMTKTVTLPLARENAHRLTNYPPPGQKAFAYDEESAFKGEDQTIELDAEVLDVAWGGGGRYAVIQMVRDPELLVYDCAIGREVGRVPFETKGGSFTAGADRIILARGEEVEQWSLDPLKQISEPRQWVLGEIDRVVMGPGWTGRVAVSYRAFGNDSLKRLDFRDPSTALVLGINPMGQMADDFTSAMPAMLDSVITMGRRNKPIIWDAKGVRYGDESQTIDAMVGPLGMRVVPPRYLKLQSGRAWLPSTVPDLGVRLTEATEGEETTVDLMDLRNGRELAGSILMLPSMGDFESSRENDGSQLPTAKRMMVVPQLGFVACLPVDNRQLVIKAFDPWKAIKASATDVVFASVLSPPSVKRGEALRLDLQPRGLGEIKAGLERGPEGASVSPEGILEWNVPVEGAQNPSFIVRLTSEGGAECLWKWVPAVR